jgi:hypothetical protein
MDTPTFQPATILMEQNFEVLIHYFIVIYCKRFCVLKYMNVIWLG